VPFASEATVVTDEVDLLAVYRVAQREDTSRDLGLLVDHITPHHATLGGGEVGRHEAVVGQKLAEPLAKDQAGAPALPTLAGGAREV
jgi:hypothetical protein